MNTLQKIINEMIADVSMAKAEKSVIVNSLIYERGLINGQINAIEKYIPKLALLLSDKPTVAITEAANCANTETVMRWQDFKEQKPDQGQKVLIVNFKTGQAIVADWEHKYDLLMKEDDMWIPSPAFA